ncbi:MAG: sigma 54-interacting transcriptional regulator [Desulfomonilaceae bacterium]|nr:sigma 54-interacting transcriptional regulator [Desulfomonilaceae bacterium]
MNKPKILVVEDEIIIAEHLAKTLRRLGYTPLLGASTGRKAIEMSARMNPDLVLMDIVLEGDLDGIDAAQQIYSLFGIPVVYLTGHGDTVTLSRAKLTEPFAYLLKPIRIQSLRTTIEVALYKGEMEKKLRASEAKYRELAELLPQLVYELDEHGYFTFLNRVGMTTLGRIAEDRDKGLSFLHIIEESDRDAALLVMKRVLSGEALVEQELTAVKKDGTTFPMVTYNTPIGAGGNVLGIRGVAVDITERREMQDALQRANADLERRVAERTVELYQVNENLIREIHERKSVENELRAREEMFRTVFEGAQDCIFIKDENLRYTHVNQALLDSLKMSTDQMLGKTDPEIFETACEGNTGDLELRVLGGQVVEAQHSLDIRGMTIVFHCVRVPMRDAQDNVWGICGIARELTQRKRNVNRTVDRALRYPSRVFKDCLEHVQLAAGTDSIVLFLGESGTGKDFLAAYLHAQSKRANGPFFTINCAALTSELAESELFGHESGAFTGANRRKKGLLELAEGGTLLLNEIGDLSPHLQSKLLTFLDTRSFTRVGGEKLITVNARLVGATNRDLAEEVSAGRFRADLYYRLNVLTIRIPPLRERKEDLPILVEDVAEDLAEQLGLKRTPTFDEEYLSTLQTHDWPGNIRELRNLIERSLILKTDPRLGPDLQAEPSLRRTWNVKVEFPENESLNEVMHSVKKDLIEEALRRSEGNQKVAAGLLGVTYDSFRHHLKSLED